MKKKLWHIIPLLLLILCLLGPVIHSNKQVQNPAPPEAVSSVVNQPNPASASSGETENTAPTPAATNNFNSSGKEGSTTTDPVSSPPPEQGSLPLPPESTASEAETVYIAVVGKNGELLFEPGTVNIVKNNPHGTTALGVLAATGLPYEISQRYPDFVEAVASQRNKGQAGWLYKVNDEVPLLAANKKPVAANDHVIWWYSSSIHDLPPSWEQLANSVE